MDQPRRSRTVEVPAMIFSFIVPSDAVSGLEAEALAVAAERAAAMGEPWLTRLHPDELRMNLQAMGFTHESRRLTSAAWHGKPFGPQPRLMWTCASIRSSGGCGSSRRSPA